MPPSDRLQMNVSVANLLENLYHLKLNRQFLENNYQLFAAERAYFGVD